MSQTKVSYKRHLAKTITYRILSTTIGFLGMWWVSGDIKIGAAFGVVELIYKPIQYYIHERIWYKWIKFGLNPPTKKEKKPIVPPPSDTKGKKVLSYKKPV
jgi:uncharacterized membrane protein